MSNVGDPARLSCRNSSVLLVSSLALCILFAGCGSSTHQSTPGPGPATSGPAASSVSGTASLGAPVSGASVTLKDSNGATSTATTAADGTYTLNTGGLVSPFLIKVVTNTSSGSFPAGTTLYSVSADALPTTTINTNVLTDMIVRAWYSAQGVNVDTAFANPVTSTNVPPTPMGVQIIANTVIQVMQLWFNKAGVTVVAGTPADNTQLNLISSTIPANNTKVDAVLHLTSLNVNTNNGSVTQVNVTDGTTTQTSQVTYNTASNAFTVNTTTTNGSATTSESISGIAPNNAQLSVVNGINTTFSNFKNTVNSKGSALAASDLLPFYANDYLNGGLNRNQDAADTASMFAGGTINSLQILAVKSVDTTNGIADVIFSFNFTQGGSTQAGTQEFLFELSGGSWLLRGDQRIARISLVQQTRNSQGFQSGSPSGAYINVDIQGPQGTLKLPPGGPPPPSQPSSQTVSGGGSIWPICSASGPCSGSNASTTINYEGTISQRNGSTIFDHFAQTSNLLTSLIRAGTSFTFRVTPASGSAVNYTLVSNVGTNELVSITSPTSGSLASYTLGQPMTVTWTLPKTFAVAQVKLGAETFDGDQTLPSTHACGDNGIILAATATSGTITIPTTCNGIAVKQVDLDVQVLGVNGESAQATVFIK